MAYINREQVCENCNNKNCCENEKCPVYKVPTADVVPKSEVEKIFEDIERTFNAVLVGDISDILKVLTELKKKYTESEDKG